eukprot:13782663-Alexandrium_andersonii.AAC.1
MASWRPGSMYPLSPATASIASAQFHEGPWVVTAPSSCLLRHSETAGLPTAACRSSCGAGGPRSVRAVVNNSRPPPPPSRH